MEYNNIQQDKQQDTKKKITSRNNRKYTIPVAIIIAGIFIAGALFINNNPNKAIAPTINTETKVGVPAVSADDHILGNPNAKVIIVEYSDFECPFCKDFHNTMHTIIDEYGPSGDVAWVYRHFPITQLHSKSIKEAEASECAAELGGNKGFWSFEDKIFEITPSNNGLDLDQLPTIAMDIGLDPVAFKSCLDSGRYTSKVQKQLDEVTAAGGRGTPHSVIFVGDQQASIEGAQPIKAMRRVIETLLNKSGKETVPVVPTQ